MAKKTLLKHFLIFSLVLKWGGVQKGKKNRDDYTSQVLTTPESESDVGSWTQKTNPSDFLELFSDSDGTGFWKLETHLTSRMALGMSGHQLFHARNIYQACQENQLITHAEYVYIISYSDIFCLICPICFLEIQRGCSSIEGVILLRLMRVMKSLRAIRMVRSLHIFRGLRGMAAYEAPHFGSMDGRFTYISLTCTIKIYKSQLIKCIGKHTMHPMGSCFNIGIHFPPWFVGASILVKEHWNSEILEWLGIDTGDGV